jgi:hypothetical protein
MRILVANPTIGETFRRGSVTKESLKQFGGTRIDGGPTLGEVLELLPSGVSFKTLNNVANALAEVEGGKATTGGDVVLSGASRKPVEDAAEAPIESFAAIPVEARAALGKADIKTVGDLANATAAKVDAALEQGGFSREPGDASAFVGAAELMGFVG